ncbi:hypothetical protein J5X84_31900 [Streptosporangiaceae bacterium NEAU-GS5]|nr:hypothetical protein [Streptosporangiaceae bacterium NEAU-GS5]
MSDYIDLDSLWKVLVIGLVAGAGLVSIFAAGLASLGASRGEDGTASSNPIGTVIAGLCFLIVAAGALLGIYVMLDK